MISFFDWVIKFREEENIIGFVGSDVYNDEKFPKDITSVKQLENYLTSNSQHFFYYLKNFCESFEFYYKEMKETKQLVILEESVKN